jgi:RNA polymerase sigma factor (sigma-70 family)
MSPWISIRFLQTQSDERLLAAARDGHEQAFEALVHRYRRPLLRYCRRMLLPEAAADDAVQQGLLKAWLALQQGTEVREARAWLYRVVHNAAVDALRSSRYDHEQLSDSLHGATAPYSDVERRIAVRQALAGLAALPELQRAALLRTAIEGHSHEEVAAALGLSDDSVRGLVYRARATLRASATAITPTAVVAWLADAGRRTVPLAERLGAAGAGGGSDAGGALLKGGVAMLTAGVLVAGAAAVHPQVASRAHHRGPGMTANQLGAGTAAYQGARTQHQGPGISPNPPRDPASAHDSARASGIGNVGHAGAGGTAASSNPAEGSARERRFAISVAPSHQSPYRGQRSSQPGASGGKSPTTAGNAPLGGEAAQTAPDSATGRSRGSRDSQGVGDSSYAGRDPTRDGSNEGTDRGAGSDAAGSPDAGTPNAAGANAAGANAGYGDPGNDDAGYGAPGNHPGNEAREPVRQGQEENRDQAARASRDQ